MTIYKTIGCVLWSILCK